MLATLERVLESQHLGPGMVAQVRIDMSKWILSGEVVAGRSHESPEDQLRFWAKARGYDFWMDPVLHCVVFEKRFGVIPPPTDDAWAAKCDQLGIQPK